MTPLEKQIGQVEARLADLRALHARGGRSAADQQRLERIGEQVSALHEEAEALAMLGEAAWRDVSVALEQGLAGIERELSDLEACASSSGRSA